MAMNLCEHTCDFSDLQVLGKIWNTINICGAFPETFFKELIAFLDKNLKTYPNMCHFVIIEIR